MTSLRVTALAAAVGLAASLASTATGGHAQAPPNRGASAESQVDAFAAAMAQAESALADRRFLSALNAFKRANRVRDEKSPEALLGMSRASYGLKAFPESVTSADQALKHVRRNARLEAAVRSQRAMSLAASVPYPGDPRLDEAERDFAASAKLDPALARPSFERGSALLLAYRDAAGVKELTRFMSTDADSSVLAAARQLIADPTQIRKRFAAPTFSLTSTTGQTLNTANLRGKVVVLDFWGTWCPPCRAATPGLIELNRRYGTQITIIGIGALEPSRKDWSDYITEHEMAWPQYLDSVRDDSSPAPIEPGPLAKTFGIRGYPQYIVIDREGTMRARFSYSETFVATLEEAITRAIAIPTARRPS